jgi:hypothetical protein
MATTVYAVHPRRRTGDSGRTLASIIVTMSGVIVIDATLLLAFGYLLLR